MAEQQYPTLNGVEPSWADISVTFNIYGGQLLGTSDIASIDCSDSVEFGVKYGASGGQKTSRSSGQEDNEASMTLYRSGLRKFKRALMERAPIRNGRKVVGLVGFDIQIHHTPPGETDIYLVKVLGCRLAGRNYTFAEGTDLDKVEVPLNVMKVVEVIDGVEVSLL